MLLVLLLLLLWVSILGFRGVFVDVDGVVVGVIGVVFVGVSNVGVVGVGVGFCLLYTSDAADE